MQVANPQDVLVIGGSKGVNAASIEKLREQFPRFSIMGMDGYQDSSLYYEATAKLKPSIVFVAMGSPKQEFIIQKICHANNVRVAMGLGGFWTCSRATKKGFINFGEVCISRVL